MSSSDLMFDWRKAILKSDLPPTARHVLLTLACHMNPMGESCFPSIKLLCEETGLSNRAVITHLHHAKEIGWITVGKHGFAGQRWAAHEYFPAWPHNLRNAAESFAKAVNEVHNVPKKAVNEVHDLKVKVVNVIPKGGEPNDIKAVKEVHTSTSKSTSESGPLNTSQPSLLTEIDKQIASDFLSIRKAKKAPLTQTALNAISREAGTAGISLEDALTICCERGWASFKASWLLKDSNSGKSKQEAIEERNRAVAAQWVPPELREKNHAT